jgi:carboxyl-terminal processing protease
MNDKNSSVIDKDNINQNINSTENEDLDFSYLSAYIKEYGIGNINTYKINQAESYIKGYYYKELPDKSQLAKEIVSLFVEYYYDNIDLQDRNAVTDAVLDCYISVIGDRWAFYRTKEVYQDYDSGLDGGAEFVGIGVRIDSYTLEISLVYKDSGAYDAGIQPRDIIYGVNGKTVENTTNDELLDMIKGEEGTTVKITVKRGEELKEFTVTRKRLTEKTVNYDIDENNIGHIQITQFFRVTSEEFKEAVDFCTENNAKALIIDVRHNPGGILHTVVEIIDYLVPDAEGRRITSYTNGGENIVFYTEDNHGVDVPIVVLCNENSASGAELFTAAIRDYGRDGTMDTLIVGKNTFGKGVVQTSFILYDNSAITFTIGRYNPPCDVNFDGVGVIPDIEVDESEVGTDAQLDVAIEKALELANKTTSFTAYIGEAA